MLVLLPLSRVINEVPGIGATPDLLSLLSVNGGCSTIAGNYAKVIFQSGGQVW